MISKKQSCVPCSCRRSMARLTQAKWVINHKQWKRKNRLSLSIRMRHLCPEVLLRRPQKNLLT
uniref:Uncharacterized protein n=1 Tax=Arundo donax TaxID=35708 RepID=A0A0A9EK38_ARUDO